MQIKKRKIGFVILAWNSGHVIEACLRSVFRMRSFEIRVIAVDNGSTDESGKILRQIQHELQETREGSLEIITLGRNCGTTAPRNMGLRALGDFPPDYFCILDSDTVVNEEAFITLVDEMERHREYGLIGPRMVSKNGSVQSSARCFPTLTEKACKAIPLPWFQAKGEAMERRMPGDEGAESLPVDYLQSACWLMRPELLERAGYLDEHIFYAPEDAEYCVRVWKSGYQVAYCPKAVIVHEWQRLSRKKYFSRLNWEHIKGLAYMFRKHHYLFQTGKLRQR